MCSDTLAGSEVELGGESEHTNSFIFCHWSLFGELQDTKEEIVQLQGTDSLSPRQQEEQLLSTQHKRKTPLEELKAMQLILSNITDRTSGAGMWWLTQPADIKSYFCLSASKYIKQCMLMYGIFKIIKRYSLSQGLINMTILFTSIPSSVTSAESWAWVSMFHRQFKTNDTK